MFELATSKALLIKGGGGLLVKIGFGMIVCIIPDKRHIHIKRVARSLYLQKKRTTEVVRYKSLCR